MGYLKNEYSEHDFALRDESLKSYEVWIQTELLLRVGILFSCFVYMLVRKCTREATMIGILSYYETYAKQTTGTTTSTKATESIDFMIGSKIYISNFAVLVAPVFMSVFNGWI